MVETDLSEVNAASAESLMKENPEFAELLKSEGVLPVAKGLIEWVEWVEDGSDEDAPAFVRGDTAEAES